MTFMLWILAAVISGNFISVTLVLSRIADAIEKLSGVKSKDEQERT